MRGCINKVLTVLLLVVFSAGCQSQSMDQYYTAITPALPTTSTDSVEVLEVFWYGCPHCYDFEPHLRKWLQTKPDNVTFRTMPGILSQAWVPHARAYYTAVELGVLDEIHGALFDAIHEQRREVFTESQIRQFFIELGVDGDRFTGIFESGAITDKLREAYEYQRNARITGVPAVIINGKYLTGPGIAGSNENMIKVIEHLVGKESR